MDNSPQAPDITWKQLQKIDRDNIEAFKLSLIDNPDPLFCETVLRIIPGKRLVTLANWADRDVVVKLFYEPGKANAHFERELNGINALNFYNVPTPKLLWKGSAQKNKIQVLIFELIQDSLSLHDIWQRKKNIEEVMPLMRAVTIELATQHVSGIEQSDLHLKNFLITQKQIYTLDGGSIIQHEGVLTKEQSLNHLALFFSQLGVGTDNLRQELFKVYAEARGWQIKTADTDYLHDAIEQWMVKRWERFSKKIQRSSTDFVRRDQFTSLIMYDRAYHSPAFQEFLKNPEAVFQNPESKILKAGRSSTVVQFRLDNRQLVVKRYNMKNLFHRLRRCLRKTRAEYSWTMAQRLRLFCVPTARPIAFIEKHFLGFRGKSYFVMEAIDAPHVGEYFSPFRSDNDNFVLVAERVMQLIKNLTQINLTHGDLKKTNILIKNDYPVLIDLDGMTEHFSKFRLNRAYHKELKRFMKNWDSQPTVKAVFEKLIE